MKKILSAIIAAVMMMSVFSLSAFASSTGVIAPILNFVNAATSVTVTSKEDLDAFYADFLKTGSDETTICLKINSDVTFDKDYDLSKFVVFVGGDIVINEGATVTMQCLNMNQNSFTNNGTLIITGRNVGYIKMIIGSVFHTHIPFTNNGTLILQNGKSVIIKVCSESGKTNFVNNGVLYTANGIINNYDDENEEKIDFGIVKQANVLTENDANAKNSIKVSYADGAVAGTVYSVDIAWDSMEFTYTVGNAGTWVPDDHEYINPTAAAWSQTNNTIAVTNHSNAAVDAELSYTAETTYSAISGTFSETSGTANDNKLELATANGTAVANAPTASATITLSGALSAGVTNAKIGSVTVTISDAE